MSLSVCRSANVACSFLVGSPDVIIEGVLFCCCSFKRTFNLADGGGWSQVDRSVLTRTDISPNQRLIFTSGQKVRNLASIFERSHIGVIRAAKESYISDRRDD